MTCERQREIADMTAASLRACLEPPCLPQEGPLLPLPTATCAGPQRPLPRLRGGAAALPAAACQPDNWCLIPRSALAPPGAPH